MLQKKSPPKSRTGSVDAEDETHPPLSVGFSFVRHPAPVQVPAPRRCLAPASSSSSSARHHSAASLPRPLSAASLHHRHRLPPLLIPSIRCALDVVQTHVPSIDTASDRIVPKPIWNDRPRDAERRCDPRSVCLPPLPTTPTSRVTTPKQAIPTTAVRCFPFQLPSSASASAAPCKARCCPSPNTVHGSTASWAWPPGMLLPAGELRT